MNRFLVLLLAVFLVQPSSQILAQTNTTQMAKIRIGPGDLLDVKIFNAPEMAQTVRVDDVGDTTLPLIGMVHLAGLTAEESQVLISDKYKQGNFFISPDVSVMIHDYTTQNASVLGEVVKPGVYPVLGTRSLLDILSEAGGTTPVASSEATIQRRSDGSVLTVKLSRNAKAALAADVEVQPGDKIIIPRAGIVYVIGNVNRAGGFVMDNEGKLSLLQAISLAAGTNATAALNSAKLIRKTSSGYVEVPVALKKILKGKQSDQEMHADDILYIPNSAGKSILYRGVPGLVQTAGSAAIYSAY